MGIIKICLLLNIKIFNVMTLYFTFLQIVLQTFIVQSNFSFKYCLLGFFLMSNFLLFTHSLF